jgi:hypothetical protein
MSQDSKRLNVRRRFDFLTTVVSFDEETHMAQLLMEPDPRRYDEITEDGVVYLRDKYLQGIINKNAFLDSMAQQAQGLPGYYLPSPIKSMPVYAERRSAELISEIETGQYVPPAEAALAHSRFEDNALTREVVFLSLDICGSTARRACGCVPPEFKNVFVQPLSSTELLHAPVKNRNLVLDGGRVFESSLWPRSRVYEDGVGGQL